MPIYKNLIRLLAITVLCISCTYRFSNELLEPPIGIDTVYVEPAYDTSGYALNHQILTKAFEDEIAKNGKLALTRKPNADLYVRFNISSVSRKQHDELIYRRNVPEPTLGANAPKINDFPNIKTPTKAAAKEILQISVAVEYWALREKKMIFSKTYNSSQNFKVLDSKTGRENRFLRYEESLNERIKIISTSIAALSLNDFYRKNSLYK